VTREMAWQFLYWLWVAGELGLLIATRTRQGSGGSVRDRGSLRILWLTIVAASTVGIIYGEMHAPTMFGGAPWIRTAALVLLAAALAFRWTAIVTLGRWFSVNVAIRDSQALQTHGVFSIVRHPSYTGLLLIFFAIALHTRNWIAFAIVFVPCASALLYRITIEEQALRNAFGDAYAQYAARTRFRLIPFLW
jgi:protein-S-isoprenylcysteine O-methyltransferase Ste14